MSARSTRTFTCMPCHARPANPCAHHNAAVPVKHANDPGWPHSTSLLTQTKYMYSFDAANCGQPPQQSEPR